MILFDETIRQGSPTAMNTAGPHPWVLTFSYSRAIQDPVLETWRGDETKVAEAQGVFAERVRLNGLARQGPR